MEVTKRRVEMGLSREIRFDILAIGCGVALLVAFLIMAITGNYLVFEDNPVILYAEICLCLYLIGFGIERTVRDVRGEAGIR